MNSLSRPWPLILIACVGCGETPRAPVLRDDTVYQNDREGLRFLAPDGWRQRVRASDLIVGPVTHERPLVEYRPGDDGLGTLRVSVLDLAATADLAAAVTAPSHSVGKWAPAGAAEETAVGGLKGQRWSLTGRAGAMKLAKDVVAVRRGERVYFFTALYEPKDTEAREQLRRVVGSVSWQG